MIVPKDLFKNDLKIGDKVIFSQTSGTRNSYLCHGVIIDIQYKPLQTWVFIKYSKTLGTRTYTDIKKYIYTEDRYYCNIAKYEMSLTINYNDLKGHPDDPGPLGEKGIV